MTTILLMGHPPPGSFSGSRNWWKMALGFLKNRPAHISRTKVRELDGRDSSKDLAS